jgi:CheY-like chemotaxis protein
MTVQTERESDTNPSGRALTSNSIQKRALVVEDEPEMSELLQEVVNSLDIVAVVLDASSRVNCSFQDEKFDVVLIALNGPSDAGIELVRKIRRSELNRKTPIILISDDQRLSTLSRAFEVGVSFLVHKPIDKARLTKLIYVTQGMIEHERRRFRRVPIKAEVSIRSDASELAGETMDISMNGMLVRTSHTLPVGSLVEVSLFADSETEPIVGLGSVVRIVSDTQMGILLDRFPGSEMLRLQERLLRQISE